MDCAISTRCGWDNLIINTVFSRSDVAAGELPLDSAALLAARLSWQFSSNLTLGLWGRNLLDEEYRISADDLSTEGVERSVGVELSWRS